MNLCYIYVYTDPTKPGRFTYQDLPISFLYEPFYVGKGSSYRLYQHIAEAKLRNRTNKHKRILKIIDLNINPKDYVVKILGSMNDPLAYELEEYVIRSIGRESIGRGPLTNIHPGGVGAPHHEKLKLSLVESEEASKLYSNGLSLSDIAKEFKVSNKAIHNAIVRVGIKIRPRKRYLKLTNLEVETLLSTYSSGVSIPSIAKQLQVSSSTIKAYLQRAQVYEPPNAEKINTSECVTTIIDLYNTGTTSLQLATMFDVSPPKIKSILVAHKIDIRKSCDVTYAKLGKRSHTAITSAIAFGIKINDIASAYNVSRATVRKLLKALGIYSKELISTEDGLKIVDRYLLGESAKELAIEYKVSASVIIRILHNYQIQIRGTGYYNSKRVANSNNLN